MAHQWHSHKVAFEVQLEQVLEKLQGSGQAPGAASATPRRLEGTQGPLTSLTFQPQFGSKLQSSQVEPMLQSAETIGFEASNPKLWELPGLPVVALCSTRKCESWDTAAPVRLEMSTDRNAPTSSTFNVLKEERSPGKIDKETGCGAVQNSRPHISSTKLTVTWARTASVSSSRTT